MRWLLVLALTGCVPAKPASEALDEPTDASTPLPLSQTVYDNASRPFVQNAVFLGLDVNYVPVKGAFTLLQSEVPESLLSRPEAHITVVSPTEYKALKARLPMAKINALATQNGIEATAFTVDCVGKVSAQIDGRHESAYFLVVESPDLVTLRGKIRDAYVAAGGDAATFDPAKFQPHITLGFTKRDLHEEDGVVKDATSCIRTVVMTTH